MSSILACTVYLWPPPGHTKQGRYGSRVIAQAGPWETS